MRPTSGNPGRAAGETRTRADSVRRGGFVSESSIQTPKQGGSKKTEQRLGLFARLALFLRQMVAELRKVIWPTRKELITYTWVVMVFVTVVTAIVGVLDFAFTKLVLTVFG